MGMIFLFINLFFFKKIKFYVYKNQNSLINSIANTFELIDNID